MVNETGRPVQIPDALAAEVASYPAHFRPQAPPGAEVYVLASATGGYVGPACVTGVVASILALTVARTGDSGVDAIATAWALIGSVEEGPRPEVGQRVLVLDGDEEAVGHVCLFVDDAVDGRHIIVVHDERVELPASRWALLPPAPRDAR